MCPSDRGCSNQLLGFEGPDIKLPPNASVYPASGQVPQGSLYDAQICQHNFTDLYQSLVPLANINASSPFANWRYFADPLGVMSSYPFLSGEQTFAGDDGSVKCRTEFEARTRVWYAGATAAHKAVAILISRGSTMNGKVQTNPNGPEAESSLLIAQKVAVTLLSSLKESDSVTVITFSDTTDVKVLQGGAPPVSIPANPVPPSLVIEMANPTERNETAPLIASIFNVTTNPMETPQSSLGLQAALDTAFIALGNNTEVCQKVIIVLTDGQNLGSPNVTGLAQDLAAGIKAQGQPITPFFFSLGPTSRAGDSLLQNLACSLNGTWARIPSSFNILYNMYPYFNFLARTAPVYNSSFYSGVYTDAQQLGRVFTISQPVFSPLTGDFIGVAAADTSTAAARAYCAGAIGDFLDKITAVQENCTRAARFTPCLIHAVRGANNGYCPAPADCNITAGPACPAFPPQQAALVPPRIVTTPLNVTRCCKTCAAPF